MAASPGHEPEAEQQGALVPTIDQRPLPVQRRPVVQRPPDGRRADRHPVVLRVPDEDRQAAQAPRRRRRSRSPACSNRPRCAGEVSRNRPSDGSHRTIVYLARMPTPTSSPASGQAHAERRTAAWWPSTSAQPQQQVYGESMVMSDEPAAIIGSVRRERHDGAGQPLPAEDLHGQDVEADEQQAAAQHGRQAHGASPRMPVAEGLAAGADQLGDQRPLAVVAPVEVARPVPVMGLVGGQVERAMEREIGDMQPRGAPG